MKISIITASYNYENFIKETIQSILNQTYQDWELIVIDDCSTDNSVEVIKSFKDDRIKLIVNEKNLGLAATVRRGIENATGEWIAFLESDDIWEKDCLEKRVEVAKKYPDIGLIFNSVEMFGEQKKLDRLKKVIEANVKRLKKNTFPTNIFKQIIYFNVVLTFSAAMINSKVLLETNTTVDKELDWWMFIHLARNYDVYYIPEPLTKWRMHSDSYINKKSKKVSIPINLQSMVDIYKTEKEPALIWDTLLVLYREKGRLVRKLKSIIGLPLREEYMEYKFVKSLQKFFNK